MQRFMRLLLDVWREACQNLEIGESTTRIMPLLSKRIPLGLLLVRRIDVPRGCLDTVGLATGKSGSPPPVARTSCSAEQLERLLAWCRAGKVLRLPADAELRHRAEYVPSDVEGEVLLGPLCSGSGPVGLLALVAERGEAFSTLHLELAQELLAPFTAALDNDRHQRELSAQQHAAEADRHSLLTRLGRQDISEAVVGVETGLKPVMERVELVACSDVPVLLLGETGSGKEVIARALHTRSGRADGPFLRVNCGAIPPDLIDSELFGHERGSFTGAVGLRKGWFERADGGTLFLDEVGELPLAAQVRLLRILQDGIFERVGGQRALTVDVRVVAATNQDLQQMASEGRFRDDLWYRLAVFPIELPALRDRPEDMPALATHFALRAARRFGLPVQVPTPDDVNLLLAYDWPGNIRELASVINRAAILGNGRKLEMSKALGTGAARLPTTAPTVLGVHDPQAKGATFLTLAEVMDQHIKAALTATKGRIEGPDGAAHLLDINPHTLRGRMRKLGIKWNRFRAQD